MPTTTDPAGSSPDLTLLVLVSERPGPLTELLGEWVRPLTARCGLVECIVAVEPGLKYLTEEVRQTGLGDIPVSVLVSAYSIGETGLVRMALPYCQAPRILLMSAYHRVVPDSLPDLVQALDDADLVVARRWPRKDSWASHLQGRLFHRAVRFLTGSQFHDIGSGVRSARREVLQEMPLYGDYYRFLPVLAVRDGFRVVERDCPQHPGDAGARIYQPGIYLRRLVDILGLYFLVKFTQRPLRFFGLIGSALFFLGALVTGIVALQRAGGQGLADRPLLLFGVLLIVLGVQAVALGLVGEIIVHFQAGRFKHYRVASWREKD